MTLVGPPQLAVAHIAAATAAASGTGDGAPGWLWIVTLVAGPLIVGLDLYVVQKLHPRLSARAALVWTSIWFVLGLAFAIPIVASAGSDYGVKYSTGYLLEKALTIEQVFVIALIIWRWRVPQLLARRLIFVALAVLLVLRLPFIWLGYVLAETDSAVLYAVMAGFFIAGGIALVRTRFEHHDPEQQPAVRAIGRIRPVWPAFEGHEMSVVREGQRMFTLAAVVLTALLTADLYFDATIPLAFAFTKPPYIVLASTTFALFGLRSMYVFAVSIRMDPVVLKVSLAISLWLVALDLLIAPFIAHPSWAVPGLVFVVVGAPILTSWRRTDRAEREESASDAIPEDST